LEELMSTTLQPRGLVRSDAGGQLPVPARPPRVRGLSYVMRLVAVCLFLLVWCTLILWVWVYMLAREIVRLWIANLVSIYRGAGTADPAPLDYAVSFWMRGVRAIVKLLEEDGEPGELRPRPPLALLWDTAFACLFFGWMVASWWLAPAIGALLWALAGRIAGACW
jgi:hypothetical protein